MMRVAGTRRGRCDYAAVTGGTCWRSYLVRAAMPDAAQPARPGPRYLPAVVATGVTTVLWSVAWAEIVADATTDLPDTIITGTVGLAIVTTVVSALMWCPSLHATTERPPDPDESPTPAFAWRPVYRGVASVPSGTGSPGDQGRLSALADVVRAYRLGFRAGKRNASS